MPFTLSEIDNLIHRMYRLFNLSKCAMEKEEIGQKLKSLINKRDELVEAA